MPTTASFALALAFIAVGVSAQTVIPPGNYASLTIPKGTTRRLAGTYKINRLTVAGTLLCGSSATVHPDISLTSINIQVKGTFTCGTLASPYKGRVTITMTGSGAEGTKVVDVTGTITMTGRPRASWTTISSTILPGQSTFTTATTVDWRAGERIVMSSTDFDWKNAEEATITSVTALPGGGSRVSVKPAFKVAHYGQLQTYSNGKGSSWVLDERAQVALLERNIVFQGDGGDMGAIITVRAGGNGYVQDVKFTKVGQKGRLGTYPWHWHMLGNRKGNYFRNNVVMKSTNRCVTIHGTDNVLVERNVCYDNIGHAYFIEDGCEEGNILKYNLGLSTKLPASKAAGAIDTDTTHLSTFWITNPLNYLIGNVAAGSEMAGFWYMLPKTPTRECFGKVKPGLVPNQRRLGAFDNNVAHSNFVGVGIEGGIKNTDRAPTTGGVDIWDPPTYPRMTNNTIYKNTNGQRSLWVTMAKTIYFDNTKLADNGGSTLFSGAQMLRNSIIVGESANIYTNRRKNVIFGFGLYDGPAGMVNTHFAGFDGQYEYAMPVTGAGTKSWNFYMEGVTFAPGTRRKLVLSRGNFSQSEVFSQGIIDKSGSLTGKPNTLILMPLATAGLRPPSRNSKDFNIPPGKCTFSNSLGTYVCPSSVNLGTMMFLHRFRTRHTLLDVARSDGRVATIDSSGRGQYQFNVILDSGISYTATFRDRNSLKFTAGKPDYFEIILRNVDVGKAVPLTLRNLPTSSAWMWAVTECYSHRVLVKPTKGSSVSFRVTAGKPRAGTSVPPAVYPNQKIGTVRIKVCAHPTGRCMC